MADSITFQKVSSANEELHSGGVYLCEERSSDGLAQKIVQFITKLFLKLFFKEPIETAKTPHLYTIICSDLTIDITVHENPNAQSKKRFMVYSGGFFQRKETMSSQAQKLMTDLDTSVITFNYPGIGKSEGTLLSAKTIKKTHRILLAFTENVLKAKEVISYGYSMGGLTQAGLEDLAEPPSDVKRIFVVDRSANSAAALAKTTIPFSDKVLHLFGFELNPFKAMQDKGIKPIVIQSAQADDSRILIDSVSILENDDFVPKEATFAKAAFDNSMGYTVIGIKDRHFEDISDTAVLKQAIEKEFTVI